MNDIFDYTEYLIFDENEEEKSITEKISKLKDESQKCIEQEKFCKLLKRNMGIRINDKYVEHIDIHYFTDYCIKILYIALFNGERYIYNMTEHFYEKLSDNNLMKIFYELIKRYNPRLYTTKLGKICIDLCDTKADSFGDIYTLNNGKYLVMQNGTYDLEQQTFKYDEFYLDVYNTSVLQYSYEGGEADNTKWYNFLNDIFNHDWDTIFSLQEMFGYCFYYGGYPIQKMFIMSGGGRNGKGVIAHILEKLIGVENVSATPIDKLASNFGFQDCYNKYVNISPERENQSFLDTTFIKSLTGGDSVTIEQKYKNSFSTKIYCKFILLTNDYISSSDQSKGFFDRLHIFQFPNTYHELVEGEERSPGICYQDPELEYKLQKELPGIFVWAMVGYRRLQKRGWKLTITKQQIEAKRRFYYVTNPINHFEEACINIASGEKIMASYLYKSYCKWKDKNNISDTIPDKSSFQSSLLKTLGNKVCKKYYSGNLYYFGISLKENYIEKTVI